MTQKLTIEDVESRVRLKHGDNLVLDVSTYVNVSIKCRFIDVEFGEWWVKPDNVFAGQQHPRKWRQRNFVHVVDALKRIFQKHGDIIKLDVSTYKNCTTPARFVDCDYGEWYAPPLHVIDGHGHPKRGIATRSLKHVISVTNICDRIFLIHGDQLKLDVMTYKNCTIPARFIDCDYGEWWSRPNNVLNGHSHPMRAHEKKMISFAKTLNSNPIVLHWNTGVECISQSGYEYATLLWLNKNRYDFDWQIPFLTPFDNDKIKRKSIYTIDLKIKTGPYEDTWVEIKGYWASSRKTSTCHAKRNWEWFHENYPNSQLWMKSQLLELGILRKDSKVVYDSSQVE